MWNLKDVGIDEAAKVLDTFLPPPNPVNALCYYLQCVADSKNERVIYGEVTGIQFVVRKSFEVGISTDVTIKISDPIKGPPTPSVLAFTIPGGVLPDGTGVSTEKGTPVFETGEEVIVFLRTNPNRAQYPHGGRFAPKYGKITVQNNRVSIPYTFTLFKIVSPGSGSVEQQGTRWLSLPVHFFTKMARATLLDAGAVKPIDEQLRNVAKFAPKDADEPHLPNPVLLNRLEALIDSILKEKE